MSYTTQQIIEKLRELKIVPVIALDNADDILPLADTLAKMVYLWQRLLFALKQRQMRSVCCVQIDLTFNCCGHSFNCGTSSFS